MNQRMVWFKIFTPSCFYSDTRISNAMMESRVIAKAPEGEGCPRCGGYVYAAEQMLARGRVRSLFFYCFLLVLQERL